MAAFATMAAAELRARTKVADKTWVMAHACAATASTSSGGAQPAVRFDRFMNSPLTNAPSEGGWIETTDDTVV